MRDPSYNDGYHSPQSGFKGKNPNLWEGCVIAMDPGLGNTGTALFDHSGYANHGTLVNLATTGWAVSEQGQCLEFNATNDYLTIPYAENYATPCVSWSIWVKSTEAGGNLGLISRWQNVGGTYSWVVTWEASGMNWYMAGLSTLSAAGLSQNDGKWHHLCGVYNKVTAKLYMDGIERASVANTGDYSATSQPLVIGTYATSQDWDGQWRAFGLWCRPLTTGEVCELASNPAAMYQLDRRNSQLYVPLNAYLLTADYGSYSLTGQAANLLYGRTLLATNGSYTLNGQDAGLVSTRLLACNYGSFVLTGQDAGLNRGYTITADQGSYTLTGQAAGLLATRTITAAQGSYSLTGQAAGLLATRTITAAQGSYALTGQAVNLLKSTVITADVGSFAVNGQAVSLNRGYAMVAGSGSYALNGQDAGLTRTYVVACDYGSYAVNGQDAGLLTSRLLTSDVGTYSLTGQSVGLFAGRSFAAAVGEFALNGQSVSLVVAVPIRTRCVTLSKAASYSTTVVSYSRNATVTAAATYSAVGEIDRC